MLKLWITECEIMIAFSLKDTNKEKIIKNVKTPSYTEIIQPQKRYYMARNSTEIWLKVLIIA